MGVHFSTRVLPALHRAISAEQVSTSTSSAEQPRLPQLQTPPGDAQHTVPPHGSALLPTPTDVHEHDKLVAVHLNTPQVQSSAPRQQTTFAPIVASLHSATGACWAFRSQTQNPKPPGWEQAPALSLPDDEQAGAPATQVSADPRIATALRLMPPRRIML